MTQDNATELLEFPEFIDLIMLKYLLIHNKTATSKWREHLARVRGGALSERWERWSPVDSKTEETPEQPLSY